MYTLKGLFVLYIAILVEVTKSRINQVLSIIATLLILAIAFNRIELFLIIITMPLGILFAIAIISYKDSTDDNFKRAKFDDAVDEVLDSLTKLALIK
jgi:hypothetical protein